MIKPNSEQMQDYLDQIDQATGEDAKEQKLQEIIRKENRTLPDTLNVILTTILLAVVIYATIKGHYTDKETTIQYVCPNTNQTGLNQNEPQQTIRASTPQIPTTQTTLDQR